VPAVGWAAAEHPDEESGGSPCGTGEGIGRRLTGSDDGVVGGCRWRPPRPRGLIARRVDLRRPGPAL